ncbi:MAG: alkaline phosphatase [Bacteroidota bacterium]|nr:alkaline phosphatase [Bacteroidota bacterium]
MKKIFFYLLVLVCFGLPAASQVKQAFYVPPAGSPKNIIIIVANGLGTGHFSAFTADGSKSYNLSRFKNMGLVRPASSTAEVADPRAIMTSFVTGHLTQNGLAGVDRLRKPQKNLAELAKQNNMLLGLVTTTNPLSDVAVSFFGHPGSESDKDSLAKIYLDLKPDILIGGGSSFFGGKKYGKSNLMQPFADLGYAIENKANKVGKFGNGRTIALVAEEEMFSVKHREDFLSKASLNAIRLLSGATHGYILFIENEYLHKASSGNDMSMLQAEFDDLDKTLGDILNFVGNDNQTLVIVTGLYDLGTPVINGFSQKTGKPEIDWSGKSVTGNLVPLFAHGPGSENFSGIYDFVAAHNKLLPYISGRY